MTGVNTTNARDTSQTHQCIFFRLITPWTGTKARYSALKLRKPPQKNRNQPLSSLLLIDNQCIYLYPLINKYFNLLEKYFQEKASSSTFHNFHNFNLLHCC